MENFLKNLGSKTVKGLKDLFTLTDEEKASGKQPNIIEKTTGTIGEYIDPKANKVRAIDVAREVPGATGKIAADIVRSIPRAILSTALTVAPKKTKEKIDNINPEEDFGTLGKVLLGDERIKTIPIMGEESLESFGVNKENAKKFGPVLGFGLTALDLYPGTTGKGKGIKKALETGAKEVAEQVAKKGAKEIVKEGGEKEIKELFHGTMADFSKLEKEGLKMPSGAEYGGSGYPGIFTSKERAYSETYGPIVKIDTKKIKVEQAGTAKNTEIQEAFERAADYGEDLAPISKKYADEGVDAVEMADGIIFLRDIKPSELIFEKGAKKLVDNVVDNTIQEAFPKEVFHGTTKENAESILENGWDITKNKKGFAESPEALYTSQSIAKNSDHTAGTYGDTILKIKPKKGADIKMMNEKGWSETLGKSTGGGETARITNELKTQGWDAVKDPSGEIIILNPEKFTFESAEKVGKTMGDILTGEAPKIKIGMTSPDYPNSKPEYFKMEELYPSEHDTFSGVKDLKGGTETVKMYKNKIQNGEPVPPALGLKHIDKDGKTWIEISDGHHKIQAAKELGVKDFPVQITRTIDDVKVAENRTKKALANLKKAGEEGRAEAGIITKEPTLKTMGEILPGGEKSPEIIYRGQSSKNVVSDNVDNYNDPWKEMFPDSTFATNKKEYAKQYGDNILEMNIKDKKFVDIDNPKNKFEEDISKKINEAIQNDGQISKIESQKIASEIEKGGYSGFSRMYDKKDNTIEYIYTKKPTESGIPKTNIDGVKSIGEVMANGVGKGTDNVVKNIAKNGPDGLERKFITRTREMEPTIGPLLKGKYERKPNQSLKDFADEIITKDPTRAKNIAMTETNDEAVAVASKLIEEYSQKARVATDELTKNDLYAQAAEVANEAARNLTESGRAIQAASLLGKMTPEGMARYAARKIQQYNEQAGKRTVQNFLGGAKKIPELTPDQLKKITETMTRINKMEDGIEKARELNKLGNEIAKMIPSTLYRKIINVWKAGLLTGLKTTGVNIASNISHAISEIAKDVPASLVDKIVSIFTGERTLVLTGKGSMKGASEGVKKGWDYLKTGFDERNVANKLDYKKVNFGKGKVAQALDKYVNTVFGLLGAEDQPFYYTARVRSLANQAAAQAKNQGLKGKEAVAFAQKLIENPTDDMVKYATLDAETAVFQNDSWLARKAQNLAKGIELILPFSKTPANVAQAMINYTPVGIVKTIIENIGKGRFDQRLFAQGIGRGITGTAALAIGGSLINNKMMNLAFPTSEKERKQWELEGRQPNTIMMGGKWRNVNVLGPLGMVLVIGGNLQKGINDTGSFTGGLAQAGAGAGSALTEQTFLSGVNTFIDAIKDPTRSFNGFASSLAGSIVPTLVADFARATDQYERKTNSPGQRIVSRIPGARENLQPKIDAFGKPIKTQSFLTIMLDASRPGNKTAPDNDPVAKEYRRLMDVDKTYLVTPSQLGPNAGYESLTDKENTDMWKMAGRYSYEEVKKAINERAYKRYDDEQKASYLSDIIQEANVEARARIVKQALDNTPEAERKAKLAQMKKDKLLTQEVYSRYISLTRRKK